MTRAGKAAATLATAAMLLAAATPSAYAAPGRKGGASAAAAGANDPDAQIAKGIDLAKKKKYADAIAAYERAYALNQDPKALFYVAKAKSESGDIAGAVR